MSMHITHTDACVPRSGWGRTRVTGGGSAVIYSVSTVVRSFMFPAAGDVESEFKHGLDYWDLALNNRPRERVCY